MCYDISLKNSATGDPILLEDRSAKGGTRKAWLDITCNYRRWYLKDGVFPKRDGENLGVRAIYGMTGEESIPVLKSAIAKLQDSCEELSDEEICEYRSNGCVGYWLPTKANAIIPLTQLLAFAQLRPDGVWEGYG